MRDKLVTGVQTCALPIFSPDANENSPLAVELIVVYEDKIVDKLLEKKAREWFSGREQFLRDYADDVDSWKWERSEERRVGKECRSRRSAYYKRRKTRGGD